MSVFLAILKIILLILCYVIGLAFVLLALILSVPVRYEASFYQSGSLAYQFHVSWMLHFFTLSKRMDSDDIQVRVLGIPLKKITGNKTKKKQKSISSDAKRLKKGKQEAPKGKIKEKKDGTSKRKNDFSFDTVSSIIDFIRNEKKRRGIRRLYEEIVFALNYLKPKKLRGEIRFGTGDPADTGMLTGIISLFPVVYQENLQVSPDFEEKILYVDVSIKGRLQILYLIYIALRIYEDKDIMRLWKVWNHHKGGK